MQQSKNLKILYILLNKIFHTYFCCVCISLSCTIYREICTTLYIALCGVACSLWFQPLALMNPTIWFLYQTYYTKSVHSSVYSVQIRVYIEQYTEFSVQCTVYNVKCTMYNVQCKLCSLHCIVYSVQYTVYSVQCTVYHVWCTVLSAQCPEYSVP